MGVQSKYSIFIYLYVYFAKYKHNNVLSIVVRLLLSLTVNCCILRTNYHVVRQNVYF